MDKDTLITEYVSAVIDGMDLNDCLNTLQQFMEESFKDYSYEQVKEEVEEYYPELLNSFDDCVTEPSESTGWN